MSSSPELSTDELQRRITVNYETYLGYVRGRIPRHLRSVFGPDDVLQDALVAAFLSVSSFREDSPSSFDRWMTTLLRSKLNDMIRAATAQKRGGLLANRQPGQHRQTTFVSLFDEVASPDRTPSRCLSNTEKRRAVNVAVCGLPERRRRVIEQRYFDH